MFISLKNLKKKINDKKNYLIVGPGTSGKTTLILKLIEGHLKYRGARDHTFKNNNVLFLAPNYGPKKSEINIDNWIKVLKEKKAIAIICYVPKDIQVKRLVERLKTRKRYWGKRMPDHVEIDWMVEMVVNDKLDMIEDENNRGVLKTYFYKDYFFSYDELYEALNKNKIEFCVIKDYKESV